MEQIILCDGSDLLLLPHVDLGIGMYGVVFILRYYGSFWYVAEFGVGVGDFNWCVGEWLDMLSLCTLSAWAHSFSTL